MTNNLFIFFLLILPSLILSKKNSTNPKHFSVAERSHLLSFSFTCRCRYPANCIRFPANCITPVCVDTNTQAPLYCHCVNGDILHCQPRDVNGDIMNCQPRDIKCKASPNIFIHYKKKKKILNNQQSFYLLLVNSS